MKYTHAIDFFSNKCKVAIEGDRVVDTESNEEISSMSPMCPGAYAPDDCGKEIKESYVLDDGGKSVICTECGCCWPLIELT